MRRPRGTPTDRTAPSIQGRWLVCKRLRIKEFRRSLRIGRRIEIIRDQRARKDERKPHPPRRPPRPLRPRLLRPHRLPAQAARARENSAAARFFTVRQALCPSQPSIRENVARRRKMISGHAASRSHSVPGAERRLSPLSSGSRCLPWWPVLPRRRSAAPRFSRSSPPPTKRGSSASTSSPAKCASCLSEQVSIPLGGLFDPTQLAAKAQIPGAALEAAELQSVARLANDVAAWQALLAVAARAPRRQVAWPLRALRRR